MKQWEVPHVKVDQFEANECISACTPIPFSGNPRYAYIDWHPVDGIIESAGSERLNRSSTSGHYSVDSDIPHGFYNDVTVYRVNPATGLTHLPSSSHALNETYTYVDSHTLENVTVPLFQVLGVYDVYVGSRTDVQVYPSAQWDADGTPTQTFS